MAASKSIATIDPDWTARIAAVRAHLKRQTVPAARDHAITCTTCTVPSAERPFDPATAWTCRHCKHLTWQYVHVVAPPRCAFFDAGQCRTGECHQPANPDAPWRDA